MKKFTKIIIPFVMVLALAFGVLPVYAGSYDSPMDIHIGGVSATVSDVTYNGKVANPRVVVKDSLGNTISSKYYTVVSEFKTAGKRYVTITMLPPYKGEFTSEFTIKKASPVYSTYRTVKTTSVKSKAISVTVAKKSAFTKVYKVSGSSKLTVNKYGKVVVKKGTKKGTYKIKVKIVGKAPNYYTTTRTITVRVK